ECPDRATRRHLSGRVASRKNTPETRRHRHVLAALVRICDRGRIDARAGLELPKCFAGVFVQRNELAGQSTGEDESAAGDEHAGRAGKICQRDFPSFLARQWFDRSEVAEDVARLHFRLPGIDTGRLSTKDLRFWFCYFV